MNLVEVTLLRVRFGHWLVSVAQGISQSCFHMLIKETILCICFIGGFPAVYFKESYPPLTVFTGLARPFNFRAYPVHCFSWGLI